MLDQPYAAMLNQKYKHRGRLGKTKAEKRIEEIRAEIDEVLERLEQIEVGETWRTRKE